MITCSDRPPNSNLEKIAKTCPRARDIYLNLWVKRSDQFYIDKFFIPDEYHTSTELFRTQLLCLKSLDLLDFAEDMFGFKIIMASSTPYSEGKTLC